MGKQVTSGEELGKIICEALGVDPNLAVRIVIVCEAGWKVTPAKIFIERYDDGELKELDWKTLLKDHPVTQATEEVTPNG